MATAQAEQQATMEAAYEAVCPFVLGNPFIPHVPTPKQLLFLGLHMQRRDDPELPFQALFGGACGGGKSDMLLMAAAQYAWKFGEFTGILFRRSHAEHKLPGALTDRAREWWEPAGATFNAQDMIFTFPSGAKVVMGYMHNPGDHLRYQSANFHFTGWDELTHWPTSQQYDYVGLSRVRRGAGCQIPLRTLCASNPGGPGHSWVKAKFVGGEDASTGKKLKPEHIYVPARLSDNPHLDQGPYIKSLSHMQPTLVQQLLNGDWSAREPGDYFRLEWFGPLLAEDDRWSAQLCQRVRWWDLAASEREHACRTAGVRMARHRSGVYAVEHCRAFKKTPGDRDNLIIQTAMADGKSVVVGIEIEPGSGGQAQFETLKKRLSPEGFKVFGARPKADMTDREGRVIFKAPAGLRGKLARWASVSAELETGYIMRGEAPESDDMKDSPWWGKEKDRMLTKQSKGIRLFAGTWVQDFIDELEGIPPETEAELVDCADAFAGAYHYLWAHPKDIGGYVSKKPPPYPGEQHDVHPADRIKDHSGQDKWGRYKY